MAGLKTLFPTRIYEANLTEERGFEGLLGEIEDACFMLADEDAAGQDWCRRKGYGGYTSYASLDDLPTRISAFADLKKRLDKHAAKFAETLAFDLGGGKLRLDSLWVNVLDSGHAHAGHIHPHSVISGTIYVSTPKGAGGLRLEDPRLPMMMAAPPRRADAPEELQSFVTLQPQPGTVYLWESWLRHEVLPGRTKTPRVSVSFNYAWR